ncbi:ROK family transcriptional regulator [Gorillibacterium sp. sgz5001074]|uniref:ROK family transcriptional regulator n=1 Tax=Gorillibacterium sp. sgz5001074 TaxID=3446695 RepID=UPI003F681517
MKMTGDLNLVKKINKSIVLELLQKQSPISRASLAKLTGLTKATVSTLVAELMEENLLYEIGTGESSGGRKPVMLVFRQDAGYAIGVDLGVNYIHAVLTDLKGEIIHEVRRGLKGGASQETVLRELKGCLRTLIAAAPESPYGIVGIGVGVPGITDHQGSVLFAPNLGWRNVPLQRLLEEEFRMPVTIDNEANAGAVGEREFGAGRGVSNLIYISIGIGIGTGIILKNELYRGTSGYSGEMGHISIQADGKPCRCGNIGCWELYASENALLEEASSLLPEDRKELEELVKLAEAGSPEATALFERAGYYLGVGITNIINIFNPELIIIGNRFAHAERFLGAAVRRVIDTRSLPYHREKLRLEFAGLGSRSCVAGASSFAVSRFFADRRISVDYSV